MSGLQRVKNPPIPLKDFASIESMREEINEVVAFLQNPRAFQEMGARAPRVYYYEVFIWTWLCFLYLIIFGMICSLYVCPHDLCVCWGSLTRTNRIWKSCCLLCNSWFCKIGFDASSAGNLCWTVCTAYMFSEKKMYCTPGLHFYVSCGMIGFWGTLFYFAGSSYCRWKGYWKDISSTGYRCRS